jgi:hypothetical protein
MSDKPSDLGLLNRIAVAETRVGGCRGIDGFRRIVCAPFLPAASA